VGDAPGRIAHPERDLAVSGTARPLGRDKKDGSRRGIPIALSLAILLALTAAAARSPAEVQEAVRDVLDDSSYQRELPDEPPRPPSPPPELDDDPLTSRRVGGGGAEILQALLWVFLAALAVVVGYAIVAGFRERGRRGRRGADEEPGDEGPEAGDGTADAPSVPDHERLAGDGRFEEAIHALLLAALEVLRRAAPRELPPARTSREILRAVRLEDARREALGGLVRAVELSRFGGREAGREHYESCLASYRALVGRAGGAA